MKEVNFFCAKCRKSNDYYIGLRKVVSNYHGVDINYQLSTAYCSNCNEGWVLPYLIDVNNEEMDTQLRTSCDLVTIKDIENLMEVYNIGKAPLSLALGFGEVTITRYLSGMYPSKEYSDIIRHALSSPKFMLKCLNDNKDKIGEVAYNKSKERVSELSKTFNKLSKELIFTIAYLFNKLDDITPLGLEKMLYYINALHISKYNKPLFNDRCEAWVHGPVYKNVYNLFKDFSYNAIDDPRFSMLKYCDKELTDDSKKIIDLVIDTFGIYSAKILEKITHEEDVWKNARLKCSPFIDGNVEITCDDIKEYFNKVTKEYDLLDVKGINDYIKHMIKINNKSKKAII